MNVETKILEHEKLIKILDMIKRKQGHIKGMKRHLYESQNQFEQRALFERYVLKRLKGYYYSKVFKLASSTYNSINQLKSK